mmetsp:Transcript_18027/g.45823  ORF Transcript_18027/g.45823 Transcript_18027/m.45823 type:complete len:309 (+) Transcript_18027:841-1767(+)
MSPHITMSNSEKKPAGAPMLLASENTTRSGLSTAFSSRLTRKAVPAKGSMSLATTCAAPARAQAMLALPQPEPMSITRASLNRSGVSRMKRVRPWPPGQPAFQVCLVSRLDSGDYVPRMEAQQRRARAYLQNAHHGDGNGRSDSSWQRWSSHSGVIKRRSMPSTLPTMVCFMIRLARSLSPGAGGLPALERLRAERAGARPTLTAAAARRCTARTPDMPARAQAVRRPQSCTRTPGGVALGERALQKTSDVPEPGEASWASTWNKGYACRYAREVLHMLVLPKDPKGGGGSVTNARESLWMWIFSGRE